MTYIHLYIYGQLFVCPNHLFCKIQLDNRHSIFCVPSYKFSCIISPPPPTNLWNWVSQHCLFLLCAWFYYLKTVAKQTVMCSILIILSTLWWLFKFSICCYTSFTSSSFCFQSLHLYIFTPKCHYHCHLPVTTLNLSNFHKKIKPLLLNAQDYEENYLFVILLIFNRIF